VLKLGLISGLPDSSAFVFYGAGTLRTGAVAAGREAEKISVGCLMKVEINVEVKAVRVTARTLHPAATAALIETSKSLFI